MRDQYAVAAERRKQTVRAETAVRKQAKPALPGSGDRTGGQILSFEELCNAARHDRTDKRRPRDQYRLSRESVRQMIACIEYALAIDGLVADDKRNRADVRARRMRGK